MTPQFADPTVSRTKFDRELSEYRALADEYRQRGWFLVHAEFPRVVVAFATAQVKPAAVIVAAAFDFTNYDAVPPSVRLVNPFTDEPYQLKNLPTHLNRALPPQLIPLPGANDGAHLTVDAAQPYMQAHSPDAIPFLCVAGVREYHEHPAHSGDVWELHRAAGAGRLVRLLEIIHRYGVAPMVGYNVQLVPQVGFKFGPAPS